MDVFQTGVLRRIFGPTKDDVLQTCRKFATVAAVSVDMLSVSSNSQHEVASVFPPDVL
jgi:hypothetical protein